MSLKQNIFATLFPNHQPMVQNSPVQKELPVNTRYDVDSDGVPPAVYDRQTQAMVEPQQYEQPPAEIPDSFSNLTNSNGILDQQTAEQPIQWKPTDVNLKLSKSSPYDLDSKLNEAETAYIEAINSKPNAPKWKTALLAATHIVNKAFNPQDQSEFKTAGQLTYQKNVEDKYNKLMPLKKMKDSRLQDEYERARLNALNQKPITETQKLGIAQQNANNATRRVNNQTLSNFYKNNPQFDAQNPTEAQAKELASIGYHPEDVGSYNKEKPIFANWLGSKMVWDSASGTFKDTGLDPNLSEKLKEITIQNPLTGETNTYTTTEAKAANLSQSAANMGYQIIAQREAANAQREQQANIQNAQFNFEAQKTNVKNKVDYNNQLVSMAAEAAKQSGRMNENLAEMNGYNEELQTTTQEISTIDPEKDPERYNKLVDKINNLSGKVIEAAGKTESGAKALQDLKNRGIQPPPLVKAPKVQAVKVNSGKSVPRSKDPLNLFQ